MADLLSLTADDTHAALAQIATKTTESRLPLLMLAYAAAQAENNLDCIGHRYAYNPALAALAGCRRGPRLPAQRGRTAHRHQRPPPD